MKFIRISYYGLLFAYIVILDRVTKYWALNYLNSEIRINDFLSFDFVLNRGISWSLLQVESDSGFYLLTFVVFGVTLLLSSYAYQRWHDGRFIIGELMIVAGGFSNLIDRVLYHGVIDFIVVGWGSFIWPIFNIADVFVVCGVLLMMISAYRDND